MIALLGKRDQLISDHVQEIIAHRKEISALNADYDAERESFDVQLKKYNKQRESAQREIVALIAAMKMETTADEWKVISKYQLKRLNPRQTGYQQASGGVEMIWALLAAYFLGGGVGGASGGMLTPAAVKQLSARTEEVIVDSARAEAAQQTLTELRKEVKAFKKRFRNRVNN